MKNLFLALVATVLFSGANFQANAQDLDSKLFEESVIILPQERVSTINSKSHSAKSVKLVNFNKKYKLPEKIVINDVEYYDNGQGNDRLSNDGIYTSAELFSNLSGDFAQGYILFDGFKYTDIQKYKDLGLANTRSGSIECTVIFIGKFPIIRCTITIEW